MQDPTFCFRFDSGGDESSFVPDEIQNAHLCQGHRTQSPLSGSLSISPRYSGPPAWGHRAIVAATSKCIYSLSIFIFFSNIF